MTPDNSHAERKIAKRKEKRVLVDRIPWALGHGLDQYDRFGGLRREPHSRVESAKLVAAMADISESEAAELLADALARRAANKLGE